MKEIWKDVAGFEGLYKISNFGNAKSLDMMVLCSGGNRRKVNGKILNKRINHKTGYVQYVLCHDGKKYWKYAHRLVAEAFIPNPNHYAEINHKDETKSNNYFENLEWCSHSYNNSYGTKIERCRQHTDAKARAQKIDYKALVQKIDYNAIAEYSRKPVVQLSLDGKKISVFKSQREASRKTGTNVCRISQCCLGNATQSNGFRWEFLNQPA